MLFLSLLTFSYHWHAEPSLADRTSLWPRVNPVAVVDLFASPSPAVRVAASTLFAIVSSKPGTSCCCWCWCWCCCPNRLLVYGSSGAAAGLQKDASVFTKLGDALLAGSAISKTLTASLASLSTVDEIKCVFRLRGVMTTKVFLR